MVGIGWKTDARKLDMEEMNPGSTDRWGPPSSDVKNICGLLRDDDIPAFEEAIRLWAEETRRLDYVVRRAGWRPIYEQSPDWKVIHNILKMDEGKERDDLLAAAKHHSPRFFAECMTDLSCGR